MPLRARIIWGREEQIKLSKLAAEFRPCMKAVLYRGNCRRRGVASVPLHQTRTATTHCSHDESRRSHLRTPMRRSVLFFPRPRRTMDDWTLPESENDGIFLEQAYHYKRLRP